MNRIEMNITTGESQIVELTAEEVAQAQAMYAQWEADEAKRKAEEAMRIAELPDAIAKQIADLQAQLNALKV